MSLESEAKGPGTTRSDTDTKKVDGISSSLKKERNRRRRSRSGKRGKENGQGPKPDEFSAASSGQDEEAQGYSQASSAPDSQKGGRGKRSAQPRSNGRRSGRREGGQRKGPDAGKQSRTQNSYTETSNRRGIYSAIDLGTNNCRLLIARPTRNGFRVIDAFSRIVRLGEGVSANGVLSKIAMDRTIEALKVCADKLVRRNVTCMRHVATEACRVAENSDEFVGRVKEETGINLDVITAGEEARLAVMGCQSLIAAGNQNALVFDIGGGSTELIWVRVRQGRASEIRGWMSIPWGVVNLSEKYGTPGGTLTADEYQEMVKTVCAHLKSFEDAHQISGIVEQRRTQLLGTSGTVTTLASLHLNLPRYIRDEVDGAWMKSTDVKALSREVAEMSFAERSAQPCIGSDRADLVVAGCAILDGILGMWEVPSLRVADRGIREGILRGLMETEAPPVRTDRRHLEQRSRPGNNRRHRTNG